MFGISENLHIDRYILPDLRVVDIQMDHFRLLGVCLQIASNTIVETHTDSDQYITLIRFPVRPYVSMHTEHSLVQWEIGWQRR